MNHQHALAELRDGVHVVRHEEDRAASGPDLADAVHALRLETLVTHREHLVDDEDLGVHVGGDREAEARVHAGAVVLHRHVDELAELAELDDAVELGGHLPARVAHERPVQEDVVAAGQVGIEPRGELDHRRHAALHPGAALGGDEHAGRDLEERALPRTVVTDEPDRLALPHLEAHATQGPELVHVPHVTKTAEDRLLQRGHPLPVHPEAHPDILE